MHDALDPRQDPGWLVSHGGYSILTESKVESRLAFGNGFLGTRAARAAGRARLDGEPLLARRGHVVTDTRTLDLRRGALSFAWTHRTPAGITASGRGLHLLSLRSATLACSYFARQRRSAGIHPR
jgi:trehalose/maltose hydrolase-like predicted phosphorylase